MKIIYTLLPMIFLNFFSVFGQITLTVKPINSTGKDAIIITEAPNTNYGNHINYYGQTWSCSSVLCLGRGLITFDLSSIPANSIVTSAILNLYADVNSANGFAGQPTYGTANAGYIRRITQTWDENTVTWNNQPLFTTQNEVILPQSTSLAQDYAADVTNLVQDMVNDTSNSFGFLLMEQNETSYYNSLIFGSGDNTNTAIHPKLEICFSPSGTNELAPKNDLIIYPNPSNDYLSIKLSNVLYSGEIMVSVFNSIGELVYTKLYYTNSSILELPLKNLSAGLYSIQLKSQKTTVNRKFIKQ